MDWQTLRVAEWLPDQPDLDNPGATVALNCFAAATSYKPISSPENYSQATSANNEVRGAHSIKNSAGQAYVYAGDAGKLYQLSATGWNDISVAGAYSGTSTQEVWKFADYGPNMVIATNYNNSPQKIVPGSAAVALGGSPPRARYVAQVRDWVVLANLNDGTARSNRVQWSGYNNAEYWTRDVALQSDYQDLYEGGAVTGLGPADGGCVVVQESAAQFMSYAGPPVTWAFNKFANALGSKTPGSVVSHNNRVWWWGESDIWQYTAGQCIPIGAEKVARTLLSDFDQSYAYRVRSAVDPINGLVLWAYPGTNHNGGIPNKLAVYAYNVGKWTVCELEVIELFQFLSAGITLEGLDALSASIDALSASLDSTVYMGGQYAFACFSTTNKLQTFTGTPLSAVIDTAELRAQPGRFTEITNTRPLYEGGTARVRIGRRKAQTDPLSWTAAKEVNASGECNFRTNSRFTRARLELSGNWTQAIGIDAYMRVSGTR